MPDDFETAFLYRRHIIVQPSHGRIVQIETGLDCGRRVLLAPNRIGEGKVSAGAQQAMTDAKGIQEPDAVERAFRLCIYNKLYKIIY